MRKEKNINFDRIRGFFRKPLNVLALLLVVFFLGSILIIITIYTKDKPAFIPEEARGSTRGAIIENIGEPLKSIFEPLGNLIVGAAYMDNNQPSNKEPETKNTPIDVESKTKEDPKSWPLYVDTESGISIRHPENWHIIRDGNNIKYFIKEEHFELFNKQKNSFQETGIPFWAGIAIGYELQNRLSGDLVGHVSSYLGTEGVLKEGVVINGVNALRVIDRGEDRYGGGVGYFYFMEIEGKVLLLSLDYFGQTAPDNEMLEVLNLMAFSVK